MFYVSVNIGLIPTVISSSSSTVTLNCLPQRQQNISAVSQPSSCVTIVSDTHTTISSTPGTTVSVIECLTTNNFVVTSISGQDVSNITTTSGMYVNVVPTQLYVYIFRVMYFHDLRSYQHIKI